MPTDTQTPYLWLYQLFDIPGAGWQAIKIAEYGMPEMTDEIISCDITCRLDPSPWAPRPRDPLHKDASSTSESESDKGKGREDRVWPEHGPPPFAPLPSNRIIVIWMSLVVRVPDVGTNGTVAIRMESRNYTGFVKAETLLEKWKEVREKRDAVPTVVPWGAWGPKGSRFLLESTDLNCVCYVYGLRYCRRECPSNVPLRCRGTAFIRL